MTFGRLLLVALFAVALIGAAVMWAQRPAASCPVSGVAADPYDSPAAWHYRQGQPNHWRSCMLQH